MIFKLSDLRKAFLYFVQGPKFYGGGGAPSQSTVTNQATIPDELKPYIDSYMKQAEQQLYNKDAEGNITGLKPYTPYGQSTDPVTGKVTQDAYKGIAAFDPLQTQAYKGAAGLSTGDSFNQAKTGALASGQGMYGSAGTALGYGQQGQGIGQQAANIGQQGQEIGQQGQLIGQQGQTIGLRGADLGQQGLNNAANAAVQQTERAGALGQRAEQLGNEGLNNAVNAAALQVARADQYGTAASGLGTQGAANAATQAGSQISSASGYGASGAGFGTTAAGRAGQGYDAQAEFAKQITSPGTTAAYMSPYMQNVVNQQIGAANRAYDITGAQQMGQATKANAFGGSREALMAAENERARNTAIGDIQAKGSQEAFANAQAQQQFGANLGIAGLGAGVNASQAGIQGAQAGLQGVGAQTAASNMQLQGVQAGIQGQQAGIQSVGAQTSASNMALDAYKNALAGNAQGLQAVGAQTATANMALDAYKNALAGNAQYLQGNVQNLQGNQQYLQGNVQNLQGNQQNLAGINTALQGVQGAQAGYTGANAAAGTMGNLAGQDISAQQSILKAQADAGALARAREQAAKDQSILDYTNQQNFAMQGIGTMSNLVRGIGTNNSSATTYAPAPSAMSQIGGLAATGIGAYGALKANGGVIEDKGYANGGIVGYAAGGSVEGSMRSKLEDLDTARLQAIIKENESPEMTKIAKEVMRSNYAKGGIVAFADELNKPAGSLVTNGISYSPQQADELKKKQLAAQQTVPVDPMIGLQASKDAAQKEANVPVADRVQQQKALEERYVGKDTETDAYRKSIMDERANAPDEARRQMSMRLMEFGASWASTPGAPLVAGMKALTSTLPGIMSDSKDSKKMMKDLDKSEYLLNHATRLEELGRLKEATAAKDKASELFMKHEDMLTTYGLKKQQLEQEATIAREKNVSAETQQGMHSGAQLASAQISANARGSEGAYTMNQQQNNAKDRYELRAKELAALEANGLDVDKKGIETPAYTAKKQEVSDANTAWEALSKKPKTEAELKRERFATRYNAKAPAAQGAQ